MAVTWEINSLDSTKSVGSLSDVITTVHWTAKDVEVVGSGESAVNHIGYRYGAVGLAEPDASSFVAYNSVTKENAIAWAKAVLGADEVTAIETDIAAQITESKTPTRSSGVPW
tara:strand:+ start:198 stop:536 length:339 start_codon:yes stop_codon:yes gene_type:complete